MIAQTEKMNLEKSDGLTESTFRIKTNAKAFQILSSGLYSDKIKAILRELSANAYDSHVEAGNSNPFDINLPNDMEPNFYIRDYGTGISHEDILSIYTTYFDSTRSTSNEMVGMMGLGSKSPFAYTDSFSVTSWHSGMKRIYNAYVNDKGIPSITLMVETKSGEPTGLEVKFPVKSMDMTTFRTKARTVFSHFKIVPNITGQSITIAKQEYFLQRSNWGLRKNNNVDYHSGARAIMGNIAYPLEYPDNNLTETQQTILNTDMDIVFPIGELDVSASRESLSYDKVTKANIAKRLDQITHEISQEIISELAKCQSLWDARLLVYQLASGAYSKLSKFLTDSKIPLTWGGYDLFKDVNLGNVSLTGITSKVDVMGWSALRSWHSRRKTCTVNQLQALPVQDNLDIFVHDGCKHIEKRMKRYFENLANTSPSNSSKKTPLVIVLKPLDSEGLQAFKKTVGMLETVEFKPLSLLPFDPIVRKPGDGPTYNPKNAASILVWNDKYTQSEPSLGWDKIEVDLTAESVYVHIERYEMANQRTNAREYINICQKLCSLIGLKFPTIYGVKTRELEKISKLPNWQLLDKYMETPMENFFKQSELIPSFKVYQYLRTASGYIFPNRVENSYAKRKLLGMIINNDIDLSSIKYFEKITNLHSKASAPLMEWYKEYDMMQTYIWTIFPSHVHELWNLNLTETEQADLQKICQRAIKYVEIHYPLLILIFHNMSAIDIEDEKTKKMIKDYMQIMDKMSTQNVTTTDGGEKT